MGWIKRLKQRAVLRYACYRRAIKELESLEAPQWTACKRPEDDGHPVQGVLEVVEYQDGLRRIQLIGEVARDALMEELRGYFYGDKRLCPVCGRLIARRATDEAARYLMPEGEKPALLEDKP